MRRISLLLCFIWCVGCSYVSGVDDDINKTIQYDDVFFKLLPDGNLDFELILDPHLILVTMARDSLDNEIIIGRYDGAPDLGFGPFPMTEEMGLFALKLDTDGNLVWAKGFNAVLTFSTYLGDLFASTVDLAVDESDNIIISGNFDTETLDFGTGPLQAPKDGYPDIFMAKLDSDGKCIWANSFGSVGKEDKKGDLSDYGLSVSVSSKGPILLTGYTYFPINFGAKEEVEGDYLAAFDPDGNAIWAKSLGHGSIDLDLSVAASGNILLNGRYFSPMKFDGKKSEKKDVGMFIALFDGKGEYLWSMELDICTDIKGSFNKNHIKTDSFLYANSKAVFDGDDNIVIAAVVKGGEDLGGEPLGGTGDQLVFFVAKLSPSKELVWSKTFIGDFQYDYSQIKVDSVVTDGEGNVILSGLFLGSFAYQTDLAVDDDGNGDAFIIKLDSDGNHVWSRVLERAIPRAIDTQIVYSRFSTAVDADSNNNVVFIGGSPAN